MEKLLNNLLFIFPVMIYFAFEAIIVGMFISTIWKYVLSQYFFELGYFQIVAFYWIVKMLFFDVFKLISGLSTVNSNVEREINEPNI